MRSGDKCDCGGWFIVYSVQPVDASGFRLRYLRCLGCGLKSKERFKATPPRRRAYLLDSSKTCDCQPSKALDN